MKTNENYIEIEIDGETYFTFDTNRVVEIEINSDESEIVGVCPPIPGKIVKILKKEGTRVKKGEQIAVLDAMKMYNFITSPVSGKIYKVLTHEGEKVKKNNTIIEIICN